MAVMEVNTGVLVMAVEYAVRTAVGRPEGAKLSVVMDEGNLRPVQPRYGATGGKGVVHGYKR